MASQGPYSPGTIVSQSGPNPDWSTPSNAASSDNSYASNVPAGGFSDYLKATNFGFTIPTGAIIDGIVVEVEKKASATFTIYDSRARLVRAGTIEPLVANDRLVDESGSGWPSADAYSTHGSSSDLWSGSWTYSDINNSGFGFAIMVEDFSSGTAYIDHIRVTVYYTPLTLTTDDRNAKITGKDTVSNDRSAFVSGGDGRYVEDFSTTTKKDAGNTTASWTGDGTAEMT